MSLGLDIFFLAAFKIFIVVTPTYVEQKKEKELEL
jgi:hypothetical protein